MTDYPFTNSEEERRKEIAKLSDFRRSSQSTLKYLSATMKTAIKSLQEDGISEEELDAAIERFKEEAKEEARSEKVNSRTKDHLKEIMDVYFRKRDSDSERERRLAEKCLNVAEWYLRPKELDVEDFKPQPVDEDSSCTDKGGHDE